MKKNKSIDNLYMTFKEEPEFNGLLKSIDFKIEDNLLSAFYKEDELIFVLDKTINETKPNVLLIIEQIDGRKWDDILANDYNVTLELIRPKIRNKYRKLDIDYDGLNIYKNLIEDYKNGNDLTNSLNELANFRNSSIKMAASQRLVSSQNKIRKSSITVDKTDKTLSKLQEDFKKLRLKLQKQRKKNIDPEKIKKTEDRIQNLILKMRRSKKRLKRAEKRLETAKKDSDISEEILKQKYIMKTTKAIDVMSEDVKPLFDKDPEVMDEKIAFKPINFDSDKFDETEVVPNMSSIISDEDKNDIDIEYNNSSENSVIDSIKAIEEDTIEENKEEKIEDKKEEPEKFVEPLKRPVSPISGQTIRSNLEQPYDNNNNILSSSQIVSNRPSPIYYLVLVLLIITSIFTLFLYQKRNCNNGTPNITTEKVETVFVEEKPDEKTQEVNLNQDLIKPNESNPNNENKTEEQEHEILENSIISNDINEESQESSKQEDEETLENQDTTPINQEEIQEQQDAADLTESIENKETVVNEQPEIKSDEIVEPVINEDEEKVLLDKPEYNVSSDREFTEDQNFDSNNSIPSEEQVPDTTISE